MVGTLVRGCRCATSWCDLDLTFDLAAVTLTYKILSQLTTLSNRIAAISSKDSPIGADILVSREAAPGRVPNAKKRSAAMEDFSRVSFKTVHGGKPLYDIIF